MTNDNFTDALQAEFQDRARTYLTYRRQRDDMTRLMDREKKPLMDVLASFGTEDDKGHRRIKLDEPIHGIDAIVRQRKVAHSVDETEAEAIARAKGLYDRLFKSVMALDEDAVMVALREGLLSEQEVDRMFPKKESFALVPEKAK
jgi:hypothetical protein